jgi:WD40 repeat protein
MRRIVLLFLLLAVFITAVATDDVDDGVISSVAYSSDGKYIATAETGHFIKIYDSVTLDILREFEVPFIVRTMEFSPDNLYIALFQSFGNGFIIYEIKKGNVTFFSLRGINSISYRFDGQRIVSASNYGIIKIWDTMSGIEIMELNIEGGVCLKVSYSPDGNKIIAASMKHTEIWDANNGTKLETLPTSTWLVEPYVSYSQDGTKFLTTGSNVEPRQEGIRIYGSDDYNLLYSYNIDNGTINRIIASFVLNSNYIIICNGYGRNGNQTVTIMDYVNGNIKNTFTLNSWYVAAISPDGKNICYTTESGKNIGILRMNF